MKMKIILIILILIFLGLFIWSLFVEPNVLTVKKVVIRDEQLKGLKIVFASDFHIRVWEKGRLNKIVNLINMQNADVVLLGGDYVNGHVKGQSMSIENIANGLSKIKSQYGTFAVIGNHDGWQGKEQIVFALKNVGINTLVNENIKVSNFYIAGVDDMQTGIPDINKTLKGIDAPTILLSHTPDMIEYVPCSVNLSLAGHLHGKQINLPFLKIIPSKFGDKYLEGLNYDRGKKIYTSKGLGTSILPLRFNCLPEIVVIEFN